MLSNKSQLQHQLHRHCLAVLRIQPLFSLPQLQLHLPHRSKPMNQCPLSISTQPLQTWEDSQVKTVHPVIHLDQVSVVNRHKLASFHLSHQPNHLVHPPPCQLLSPLKDQVSLKQDSVHSLIKINLDSVLSQPLEEHRLLEPSQLSEDLQHLVQAFLLVKQLKVRP